MTDERSSEVVLTHQPCADCGSSDALSHYSDGHTYCFSCRTYRSDGGEVVPDADERGASRNGLLAVRHTALGKRRLTEQTLRFWSYGVTDKRGDVVQVANYLDDNRRAVAQKLRFPDKTFSWSGDRKKFKGLYGQWLWRTSGKMLVITEGELDAITVSQVQDNKWPVVSLVDGAGSAVKGIKEAYEFVTSFEKVVLFFDNDEQGRKAVEEVRDMLPPGLVWVAYAPEGYKDASDMLQDGQGHKIMDVIWGAKQYIPAGLVAGEDILSRIIGVEQVASYPYPEVFDKLNWMTGGGIRLGELDTWTSGSGMGKSTILKALQLHYWGNTQFNQALIHLEEPLEDTANALIGYLMGKRVGLPETKVDLIEYRKAAETLFLSTDFNGNPRFQLYDAFGSVEDNSLYSLIRYMVKAKDCKLVWLDHLSILVSENPGDDERKRIDSIMHKLKSLTVELNCYIGLVCHLRKPVGQTKKTFETGAVPTLDDLRGSGGIKQLSNGVFALSRNQQAPEAWVRDTSTITVLKCRKTGRTGTAAHVQFDQETGRLKKGMAPSGDFDDNNGEY